MYSNNEVCVPNMYQKKASLMEMCISVATLYDFIRICLNWNDKIIAWNTCCHFNDHGRHLDTSGESWLLPYLWSRSASRYQRWIMIVAIFMITVGIWIPVVNHDCCHIYDQGRHLNTSGESWLLPFQWSRSASRYQRWIMIVAISMLKVGIWIPVMNHDCCHIYDQGRHLNTDGELWLLPYLWSRSHLNTSGESWLLPYLW